MHSDPRLTRDGQKSEGGFEWSSEHERRKQLWGQKERRRRKERRHPPTDELEEAAPLPFARRFLP